jgi:hypothetical protein
MTTKGTERERRRRENGRGCVVWCPPKNEADHGHYKARITLVNGERPWLFFEAGPKSPEAERSAEEAAAHHTEKARKHQLNREEFNRIRKGEKLADVLASRGNPKSVEGETGTPKETATDWYEKRYLPLHGIPSATDVRRGRLTRRG